MVYQGTVQNGVVVFANGVQLPEGCGEGRVIATGGRDQSSENRQESIGPDLANGGVGRRYRHPRLSVNIDHYLYGHPKVKDVQ